MADLAVTNTYVAGTTIVAADVNQNFSDVVNFVNNRNSGTTSWTKVVTTGDGTIGGNLAVTGNTALTGTLAVTGTSTLTGNSSIAGTLSVTGATTLTGGVSGNTTFTGNIVASGGISNLFAYRRPNLKYVDAATVDVENNTVTANQTSIVFPDGTLRAVQEDTSAAHKYRRFIITATAEYTSGTEDSGLYSGLAEANNTWYAIYAVKSLVDSTKFVLVGTTTLPTQTGATTLNSNLGTNGWVYLGMVRNGDNDANGGDILNFNQFGSKTKFTNSYALTAPNDQTMLGIKLVEETNTDSSYAYSGGTGATDIPQHCTLVDWVTSSFFSSNAQANIYVAAKTSRYGVYYSGNYGSLLISDVSAPLGIMNSSGNAVKHIGLCGFRDLVLSGGINPLI